MGIFGFNEEEGVNNYLKQMLANVTGLKLNEEGLLLLERTAKAITYALEQIALLEQELIRQNLPSIDGNNFVTLKKEKCTDDLINVPLKSAPNELDSSKSAVDNKESKCSDNIRKRGFEDSVSIKELPLVKKHVNEKILLPAETSNHPSNEIIDTIDLTDVCDNELAEKFRSQPIHHLPKNDTHLSRVQPLPSEKETKGVQSNNLPQSHNSPKDIPPYAPITSKNDIPSNNNLQSEKDLPRTNNPPHLQKNVSRCAKDSARALHKTVPQSQNHLTQQEPCLLANVVYTAFMSTGSRDLSKVQMEDILKTNGICGIADMTVVNRTSRSYAFVSFDNPEDYKNVLQLGGTILVDDFPLFIYPKKELLNDHEEKLQKKNTPTFPRKKKPAKVVFQGTYKRFPD